MLYHGVQPQEALLSELADPSVCCQEAWTNRSCWSGTLLGEQLLGRLWLPPLPPGMVTQHWPCPAHRSALEEAPREN